MISETIESSFRDPSGFVFRRNGVVFRQVNEAYRKEYDHLIGSGLLCGLSDRGLALPHQEEEITPSGADAYKVIRPEQLRFVSHPYEWSFSQIKDAALLTLQVQRNALEKGMSLKDASAYNVQMHNGRMVFIDTLSFEFYQEGKPWTPYRQFCQHFLAPLALMKFTDVSLSQLLRVRIDGIPLPLASRLLPWRSWASGGLALHIHLHSKTQLKYSNRPEAMRQSTVREFSRRDLHNLLASLESTIQKLEWQGGDTEWADYYERNNNYSAASMSDKECVVTHILSGIAPDTVWDLGANTGRFSRLAERVGAKSVVAWDIDPSCVEANYRQVKREGGTHIIPLLLDLTNPSPAQGWAHTERPSLVDRGPADVVLALGLIHHLAISNNVPLAGIARFLARIGCHAVIEWVPKTDSQVQVLLASRKDVFPCYTQDGFEAEFSRFFTIEQKHAVKDSERVLYHLKAR